MNKIVFMLFFSLFASLALAEVDVQAMEEVIHRNMYFRDTSTERYVQLADIDRVIEELNSAISENPEDPVLWYLKGLAGWSRLIILGEGLSVEEIQAMKKPVFHDYRMALRLDDSAKPTLDIGMLHALRNFGPADVHIIASQRILDTLPDMEEQEEIEFRGGMITHLMRLERYDEVMVQIGIIENKYPDSEYAKGARQYFGERIAEARMEEAKREKPSVKNESISGIEKQSERETSVPSKDSDSAIEGGNAFVLILSAGGVLLIFISVFLIRQSRPRP